MAARHSGVTARTYTRRDDPFRHYQQAPAKYSAPQEVPTIFVVDDDVSVRESLELLISFEGWRPQTFASAQEFLARQPAVGPSCLVLDVRLPDLNGLELQERVAAERLDLPIIFITGFLLDLGINPRDFSETLVCLRGGKTFRWVGF